MAGIGTAHLRPPDEVLLRVEDLVVEYPAGRGRVASAVSGVSFDVAAGETLGLVGESGCGKSTTARAILQLPRPTSGRVIFDGVDLTMLRGEELRRVRTGLQMIFQDPVASLNPRRRVADIVREGLDIWPDHPYRAPGGAADTDPTGPNPGGPDPAGVAAATPTATERVRAALASVGMDLDEVGDRRPHEFSGGQCQRICIARALALNPPMLICDEPVSSLDVSIQAQVLNLLEDMKELYRLTMLFIAHDLAVVKNISDRVCVMYLGRICEISPAEQLYDRPAHPYTAALLESIPRLDVPGVPGFDGMDDGHADAMGGAEPAGLRGDPPSPFDVPSGCRFRTRCDRAADICAEQVPELRQVAGEQFVACHFPLTEVAGSGNPNLVARPAANPAPATA